MLIGFTGCNSPPMGRGWGAGGLATGVSRGDGGGAGARNGGVTLTGRGSTQLALVPEIGGVGTSSATVLGGACLDDKVAPLKGRTGGAVRATRAAADEGSRGGATTGAAGSTGTLREIVGATATAVGGAAGAAATAGAGLAETLGAAPPRHIRVIAAPAETKRTNPAAAITGQRRYHTARAGGRGGAAGLGSARLIAAGSAAGSATGWGLASRGPPPIA